ncbi:MAG TPA: winged helix DNA-binding domain-containing protein [Ruania sp.]|nr:winged helix DNA-binding domain-containing protein [Ruania sp.]
MSESGELRLQRLVAQRLAGPAWAEPAEAVRHLGAVQAQDLPGALTSVALRTTGRRAAQVRDALNRGEIVRTWPMRGTLHLVPAEDAGWMTALTGRRVTAGIRRRLQEVGIEEVSVARAEEVAAEVLAAAESVSRAQLIGAWEAEGLVPHRQSGIHLLGLLCRHGELALGPMDGKDQHVVRYRQWVPSPRHLAPQEALREWVRRYVQGHGPVTAPDAARWLGLPLGQVRTALAELDGELDQVEFSGQVHFRAPGLVDLVEDYRTEARRLMLLPGFDEYMLGYADRTFAVPTAHQDRIVPGGNGMFRATIIKAGRVIGVWRRAGSGARARIAPEPFTSLGPRDAASVQRAFERLP